MPNGRKSASPWLERGMKILIDMNLSPQWADALGPDRIGGTVLGAIKQLSEDIEKGALVTIDLNRTRLRLLPLSGA